MDNELYHYGVKGMKWGIRKDPARAFEKATTYADKLKNRAAAADLKSSNYHAKTVKRMARPSFTDFGVAKERRMQKKDARLEVKAKRANNKAAKFERDMRETFKDVHIKSIPKSTIDKGKAYVDMLDSSSDKERIEKLKAAGKINPNTKHVFDSDGNLVMVYFD